MAERDDYTLAGGAGNVPDEGQVLTGNQTPHERTPSTPTVRTPKNGEISERTLTQTRGTRTGQLIDKANWELGDIIDGRYEVVDMIGRGGKGIVYKVNHLEWKLELAVKMPLAHLVADEVSKARFIREAQTWVDLGLHPNIVQCWYVRELGGVPRVFMDYIGGGSLKDWIKQGRVVSGDWEKILDFMIQACDGLGYAHEQGMEVHRDIKPGNMLMSERGELLVTDFGIAKREGVEIEEISSVDIPIEDGESTITVTGSELGTPEYGAPEQWGKARHADTRADIYALGVVLFELCCGRRPFDDGIHREPPHVLIGRHLSVPAPDPRSLNQEIPPEMADLISKCLAKSPEERPNSMSTLRAKLMELYAQILGRPYRRPVPQAVELRSDALNNRAVSMLDLGNRKEALDAWRESLKFDPYHAESLYNQTLLQWRECQLTDEDVVRLLTESTHTDPRADLYLGYIHLERAAADAAEKALRIALEEQEISTNGAIWRTLGDTRMAQEKYAEAENAYQKALELIPGDFGSLERQTMAQIKTRFRGNHLLFPWRYCRYALEGGHAKGVTTVAMSPDGRFLVSTGHDMTIRLWDVVTRSCVWVTKGHEDVVLALAVSPDGRFIVSASQDTTIRIWDTGRGKLLWTGRGHTDKVTTVAVTPNGRFVVSGSRDKTLRLWSLTTGKRIWCSEKHASAITAVAVTPDGRYVLSGHDEENLYLWDIASGKRVERKYYGASLDQLGFVSSAVTSLALSPDGKYIVSGSQDKTVHLWNFQSAEVIRTYVGHEKMVTSVAITSDGTSIVSASADRTVRRWAAGTERCVWVSKVHEEDVTTVTLDPAGQWVFSGGLDKTLCQIDLNTGKSPWSFGKQEGHTDVVSALAVVPQGRFVASASNDMTVRLWDLKTVRCARVFDGSPKGLTAVAITPDRRHLLAASRDHTIWMWELISTDKVKVFEGHSAEVTALAISPDGEWVISGSEDGTVRMWDLESGSCEKVLKGHSAGVKAVAVSADGRVIISGSQDTTIRIWDSETGECARVLEGHGNTVTSVGVSEKDGGLLSGSLDRSVRLWNLNTGECLQRFSGHKDGVLSVAWSPDGHWVISGGKDRTVRIWNRETGQCLRTLVGHSRAVTSVIMIPEGQAVSGSEDGTLRIWKLELNAQRYEANIQVCRQQSHGELQSSTQRFRQQVTWARTALKSGKPIVAYKYLTHARSVPGYERAPELLEFNATLGKSLPRKSLRGRWLLRTFQGHEGGITTLLVTPDGRFAVSGSQDGTLRKWDLTTAQCALVFTGHDQPITGSVITPDGRFVISSSQDATLRLWDMDSAKCFRVYKGHKQAVTAVTVAQYGRFIVSGSQDGTLRVWNPATAECLKTLKGHRKSVTSVAVTPDKRFILSGGEDKTVRLWNHVTGECLQTFKGHRDAIEAITVAHDGNFFVSGSADHMLRVWDPSNTKSVRILRGHEDAVTSVVLTPDARFAISGSHDRTLRLWEVGTGECLGIFEQHRQPVRAVALTPDARFVMSGSEERTLYQWELDWELDARETSDSENTEDVHNASLVNRIVSIFNKYEKR